MQKFRITFKTPQLRKCFPDSSDLLKILQKSKAVTMVKHEKTIFEQISMLDLSQIHDSKQIKGKEFITFV